MTQHRFIDALTIDGDVRVTDRGLVTVAKAARTGIQIYLGSEMGRPELDFVRVYRPADEVFADNALQSYSHAPVTLDHPNEPVTPENWDRYAKGEVSTAAKVNEGWVSLPLIVKAADAIAAIQSGKRELSAGYSCNIDWTAGVSDGQEYDAVQRGIVINHLAIVDAARAGHEARIGDAKSWGAMPLDKGLAPLNPSKKEDDMSDALKTVVLGDKAVQVAAVDVSTIEAFKADAAAKQAARDAAHDAAIAAKDAEIAKKDAEIDALKGKVLDGAAMDAAVAARSDLLAKAKAIAPDVATAGLSDAAIRKAVVTAKLGDAVTGKADAYIDARFDILAEDIANADPVRDALATRPAVQQDAAYSGYLDRMSKRA